MGRRPDLLLGLVLALYLGCDGEVSRPNDAGIDGEATPDGTILSDAGLDDGGGLELCGNRIDLAQYIIPTCDGPGPPARLPQFQPAGVSGNRGRFYWVKGRDGSGFEEWSFDDQWFYLHRDTTWAFQEAGQWCDVQCRTDNSLGNCALRWKGDAADYAFTVYRDSSGAEGAPWFPRCVSDGEVFRTTFVVDAAHLAGCGACSTNFNGGPGHRVRVRLESTSWHGFPDVVTLQIVDGVGAGESYHYARGAGWIGFNGSVHVTTMEPSNVAPQDSCAPFQMAAVCNALEQPVRYTPRSD